MKDVLSVLLSGLLLTLGDCAGSKDRLLSEPEAPKYRLSIRGTERLVKLCQYRTLLTHPFPGSAKIYWVFDVAPAMPEKFSEFSKQYPFLVAWTSGSQPTLFSTANVLRHEVAPENVAWLVSADPLTIAISKDRVQRSDIFVRTTDNYMEGPVRLVQSTTNLHDDEIVCTVSLPGAWWRMSDTSVSQARVVDRSVRRLSECFGPNGRKIHEALQQKP